MSSRQQPSRRRLTPRRRMPAPNPPSPPNASRRWTLTRLKRAGSRSHGAEKADAEKALPSCCARAASGHADAAYLNELYRSQAEKAGIAYVDVWDGFVWIETAGEGRLSTQMCGNPLSQNEDF